MALKIAIVSGPDSGKKNINLDGKRLVRTLGSKEDAIAVRIDEIVKAISDSVAGTLTEEADLSVEISGSMALKGEGGVKWLFFSVGGSATKTDALKVTLKTKLKPKQSHD